MILNLKVLINTTLAMGLLTTANIFATDYKIPQKDMDVLNNYLQTNTDYHFTDPEFTSQGSPITLMMTVICNKKSSVLYNPIDRSVRQNCYIRPIPYLKVNTKLVSIESTFIESSSEQSSALLSEKVMLELKNYCFLQEKQSRSSTFYNYPDGKLTLTDSFAKTLKACALETFSAAKIIRGQELKNTKSQADSRVIFDNPYGVFENEFWEKSDIISSLNSAIKEEIGHFDNNDIGYPNIGQLVTLKLECSPKIRKPNNSSPHPSSFCWFKTIDSFKFPKKQITHKQSKGTLLDDDGYMRIQAKCYLKKPVRSSDLINMNIIGYDTLVNAPALKQELVKCVHSLYSSMQKIFKKNEEYEQY